MRKPLCVFARSCYDTKIIDQDYTLSTLRDLSHPYLLVVEREIHCYVPLLQALRIYRQRQRPPSAVAPC